MKLNWRLFWVAASILSIYYSVLQATYLVLFAAKKCHHWKFLLFWYCWGKRKVAKKINVGTWLYNPNLECTFIQVDWQHNDHNTGLNIYFFCCSNEPGFFVLSVRVCFMQFIEWVFLLTWFYLLIRGAVWGTSITGR